jgi:hypothetical protein
MIPHWPTVPGIPPRAEKVTPSRYERFLRSGRWETRGDDRPFPIGYI